MSLSAIHRRIVELEAGMAAAAGREDFEEAARLRNEITVLRGGNVEVRQPPPGQMGLGTNLPVAAPPKGWRPPKKPDLMTKNVKPRRGR